MSQLKSKFTVAYLLVLAVGLAGCEQPPQPYVPKSLVAPEVVYCNDNTGHKAGSKPFVLGGTCCCTPSDQLMALLHEDGQCQGTDTEALRALYVQAGISLRSENHQWCGGLCASGPHVVLGGKCMCPPTPGTLYYEKVITGQGVARNASASQAAEKQPN